MGNDSLEQPLAGFLRRATAYLIDIGLFFLPLAAFVVLNILLAASGLGDCLVDGEVGPCDPPVPRIVLLLVPAIVFAALIWWLIALRWGQTPGKMLLRIQVIRKSGRSSGWGFTFVREVAVKGFPVILGIGLITFFMALTWARPSIGLIGIGWYYRNVEWAVYLSFVFASMPVLVDNLWALLDRDGQTVHDKVMGTLVVQKRRQDKSVNS